MIRKSFFPHFPLLTPLLKLQKRKNTERDLKCQEWKTAARKSDTKRLENRKWAERKNFLFAFEKWKSAINFLLFSAFSNSQTMAGKMLYKEWSGKRQEVKLRKKWTRCLRVKEKKKLNKSSLFFVFLRNFSHRMLLWERTRSFVGRGGKVNLF